MNQDKDLAAHLADASKIQGLAGVLRLKDDQEDTEYKHPKLLLSESQ